jgi:hypothetical protein
MPSFLWQSNLSNRASKIKCLLPHHDIHLPRTSVKLHLWPNDFTRQFGSSNSTAKLIGKCHLEDYIVPKQSINTVPNPGSLYIVYMENPSLALATFWVN